MINSVCVSLKTKNKKQKHFPGIEFSWKPCIMLIETYTLWIHQALLNTVIQQNNCIFSPKNGS